MADALKTFFDPRLVRRLAKDLAAVHPSFPSARFVKDACSGLDDRELLDRARHIARSLARHLPDDYRTALAVLLRSLPASRSGTVAGEGGMSSFFYLPHVLFVAEHGLDDFDRSMEAQYALTKLFTAEFSIRGYLDRDPERVLTFMRRWIDDPDPHVRRLVSEGTRPRLPWARRVAWLDRNPEQVLALLERLKDDESEMVRRSVANNLNDLGRTRPDLLMRTAAAWLEGAPPGRRALVEHALRAAVKRGDRDALRLLGYGKRAAVEIEDVTFEPARVRIGERVAIGVALRSRSPAPQHLLVDLAVHFVKARGTSPKVFKMTRVALAPRARVRLKASVSLAVHTTRVPRPGRHVVELLVNGAALPMGSFEVVAARPPASRPR